MLRALSGIIGGVPVRGYVDLVDMDGRVIDLKTASKRPGKISASHRLQLTTYAMLWPNATGETRLDVLTKTKTVQLEQYALTIKPEDRAAAERLYSLASEAMQTGIVIPNRSSRLCSRRHCAFADRCITEYGGAVD